PQYECEYRVRQPDGAWHWLLARGRCLRDATGKPYRFVGSTIDVSAQKQAELDKERLEAQLREAQKMEAIGTLAGGIAHDFNNLLQMILGFTELAQGEVTPASPAWQPLHHVLTAGQRAKMLVQQMLAFSRHHVLERHPLRLHLL